jgi:hypothetical protein
VPSVRSHADLAQSSGKTILADSDGGARLYEGLPFAHQASRVVKTSRVCFTGHVFNLQTEGGWYVTNGIVTHNCRCVALPIVDMAELAFGEQRNEEEIAA